MSAQRAVRIRRLPAESAWRFSPNLIRIADEDSATPASTEKCVATKDLHAQIARVAVQV